MEPPRTISVFRALQLGDLLCAIPAVRAMRNAWPTSSITLVGQPWAAEFADAFDDFFDDFVEFPGLSGLPEREPDLAALPAFFAQMQQRSFDLAVQMHGSGKLTNPIVLGFSARETAGFFAPGEHCPNPDTFLPYPEGLPEPLRHLRLVEFLGVPPAGSELEFPVTSSDRAAAAEATGSLAPGSYVCLHPGSRFPSRRWAPQRFAALGDALAARGYTVVLTGAGSEAGITRQVAALMESAPLNVTGRTSLRSLAALVDEAALVVCNDTGVSHVAAARQTPSVVISCGSDAARWAPLDRRRHRVIAEQVDCRPCEYVECPVPLHPCSSRVAVPDVLGAALEAIEAPHELRRAGALS